VEAEYPPYQVLQLIEPKKRQLKTISAIKRPAQLDFQLLRGSPFR
jgi:hypothetical protein